MDKNPSDKSREVCEIFYALGRVIGIHMPGNPKLHPRLIFAFIGFFFWCSMIINGLIISWGDTVRMCHAMLPIALVSVYIGKTINNFYYKSIERNAILQQKTEKYLEKWENGEKYRKSLQQRLNEATFYTKMLIISTGIMYHLPALITDLEYLINGRRFLYFYTVIPFTDPETHFGFLINAIILNLIVPSAFVTLIVLDAMLVFYGYMTVAMCDVICIQIKNFTIDAHKQADEKLTNPVKSSSKVGHQSSKLENLDNSNAYLILTKTKDKSINTHLISLILEHREYNQYIKDIVALMELPCFLAVVFNSLSIALSVVVCFNISVRLGITIFLMFSFQVLSPCLIGTLIQSQNERLLNKFYDFQWENFNKNELKVVLEFIHVLQNSTVFNLPIVGVLNMELFTNVMNASYSYFTFFWNFV